jgi:hypothetical protein
MDWFRAVNSYCERTDAGYWSEPLNALSNAAFLIAAVLAWRMAAARGDRGAQALAAVLFLIGIGSFLFHTHAQMWAMLADVVPIQGFILLYLYLATVRLFGLPWWAGLLAVGLFFPYALLVGRAVGAVFGPLNGSVGYVPVPILIAAYGVALRNRAPATARGLLVGASLLAASLVFRTVDAAVCGIFPIGTHFLWHLLNGAMLGWMILVLMWHDGGRIGAGRARVPHLHKSASN